MIDITANMIANIIILLYGLINAFLMGYYVIKNKWGIAFALALIQSAIVTAKLFLFGW